jgi:hypothetical protein
MDDNERLHLPTVRCDPDGHRGTLGVTAYGIRIIIASQKNRTTTFTSQSRWSQFEQPVSSWFKMTTLGTLKAVRFNSPNAPNLSIIQSAHAGRQLLQDITGYLNSKTHGSVRGKKTSDLVPWLPNLGSLKPYQRKSTAFRADR